jgi:hypothetical protein
VPLGSPLARALLPQLARLTASRYRYRLLETAALGLAADECVRLWLSRFAASQVVGQSRILSSTVFFTMGWALVAGWVMLGGWFDPQTRSLIGQLAIRRGYDDSDVGRLEILAACRWLALWVAAPVVIVAAFGAVRASTLAALWFLTSNLLLSLSFAELTASCVAAAVITLRRLEATRVLEMASARRIWLGACLLPEVARFVLPGFPTLRAIAASIEQVILHWGAGG